MAALTITTTYDLPRAERISRQLNIITGSFLTDTGSYATGGVALSFAGKFKTVKQVILESANGYHWVYDYTNLKAVCYETGATQKTDGVAMTAYNVKFTVIGL